MFVTQIKYVTGNKTIEKWSGQEKKKEEEEEDKEAERKDILEL